MSNEEITITFEEDFVATRGSTYTLVFNDLIKLTRPRTDPAFADPPCECRACEGRRQAMRSRSESERTRIRTEFITWISNSELRRAVKTEAEHSERARIRTELIEWLVGTILPCDAGLVNGRRIVDEIDRICPKE